MIKGEDFIKKVEGVFKFLESEFGFKILKEKNKENLFYDVQYSDNKKIVSVSYENTEDYLQVIIFKPNNGKLPDYDDKSQTLHLSRLNEIVLPKINKREIKENHDFFSGFGEKDPLSKELLKKAKETRLCLKNFEVVENYLG